MPNRLADAVSPYLRSHADNPVDWQQWSPDAFAEAAERDVPVLVSIGYSTCHWCHVMARESFSDPALAAYLNANFVPIKVDREEYPDVDAAYLAAAGAFTGNLGWPLNVFVTPGGRCFYGGTYWPPTPIEGHPAFRQVLDAVLEAWRDRRVEVESNADAIVTALAAGGQRASESLPSPSESAGVVRELESHEDTQFGGFGGAPKFPVAPVQLFLLDRGAGVGDDAADARALVTRTLAAMAASDLRDEIEGGFFRYSTRRDWTDPHYERMLYDNALLLAAYARVPGAADIAAGIAGFLGRVLRVEGGGFASAQDSESTVDGERVEGGYYRLDAEARARQASPALDAKVLTGWNGLAIEALSSAGFRLDRPDWVTLARGAADFLLDRHLRADGSLVRASIGAVLSPATATLEDYGMFASGLLSLGLATGEVRYAVAARSLVDACLMDTGSAGGERDPDGESVQGAASATGGSEQPAVFSVPGGADPLLRAHGIALLSDPSEGAYPSGVGALAAAAHALFLLTADDTYETAARSALAGHARRAVQQPISFGTSLSVLTRLQEPATQLVVVTGRGASDATTGSGARAEPGGSAPRGGEADAVASAARSLDRPGAIVTVVTEEQALAFADAGFELFAGRITRADAPTAYLCRDFVCRLPVTGAEALQQEILRG